LDGQLADVPVNKKKKKSLNYETNIFIKQLKQSISLEMAVSKEQKK